MAIAASKMICCRPSAAVRRGRAACARVPGFPGVRHGLPTASHTARIICQGQDGHTVRADEHAIYGVSAVRQPHAVHQRKAVVQVPAQELDCRAPG